ncbi:hypothetical protein HPB52_010593 [Rhipicephalus sanguineus]|uniref:Uncharacterized protein n=1 Tax=Rhipicephalus sanguineus TaxID=34632 RepID=A0A9D4T9F5_RHISA|nr:hypothetical protein HPB52_010593 [Rhipicephalus sanguineus]
MLPLGRTAGSQGPRLGHYRRFLLWLHLGLMGPEWARLLEILKRLAADIDAFLEARGIPIDGLRTTGKLRTSAPGGDQRAEDENHNSTTEEDSVPATSETAETAKKDVENADSATDVQNVSDEAVPGDDEGAENVSDEECVKMVEEIVENEAGDCQEGEEEVGESQHCKKLVGEPQRGNEEAWECRDGEEDADEENAGGEHGAENWEAADSDKTATEMESDPREDVEKHGGQEEEEIEKNKAGGKKKDAGIDGSRLAKEEDEGNNFVMQQEENGEWHVMDMLVSSDSIAVPVL